MAKCMYVRKGRSGAAAGLLVLVLTLIAASAAAQDAGDSAPTAKPISVGLQLGLGAALSDHPNPWGFGFGLRGGYNLDRFYLGGRFTYHLGSSEEAVTPGLSVIEIDYNLWELGAEAGYDFGLTDRITLRPSVVVGIASIVSSASGLFGASSSGTDTKLLLSPGASGFYDITPMFFVGADLRLPLALGGDSVVGLAFYALGGAYF